MTPQEVNKLCWWDLVELAVKTICLGLMIVGLSTVCNLITPRVEYKQPVIHLNMDGWHCSKVNGQNPDKDVCVQFTKGE